MIKISGDEIHKRIIKLRHALILYHKIPYVKSKEGYFYIKAKSDLPDSLKFVCYMEDRIVSGEKISKNEFINMNILYKQATNKNV